MEWYGAVVAWIFIMIHLRLDDKFNSWESVKKYKKIFAICWGMQVAVTVAGGEVKKCLNGAHRGIAHDIEINENG